MVAQILTNIRINLKFYRRNRLLLISSILIMGVLGLSIIPAFFFLTKTKHLEIIRIIFAQLSSFTTIITAALGLLLISHHIGNRTTKMVFTKPCPPEIWLLSNFLSASLVSFTLSIGIFFICSILCLGWGIPFQWGILYITFNEFLQAVVVLSYITFLTVLFHPVIAVLFIFLFSDGVFYSLKLLLAGGVKASSGGSFSIGLKMAKLFVDVIYMILPNGKPFFERMSPVYSSLRVSAESWGYLLLAFAYTVLVASLLYLLSAYFLKKRAHI
jgi:hypothetical protein